MVKLAFKIPNLSVSFGEFGNLLHGASIILGASRQIDKRIFLIMLDVFVGRHRLNYIVALDTFVGISELAIVGLSQWLGAV